ncbi:septum formation protein [Methylopila jiangsuensis]|uniref:Maf family nucleotide pyrophosphatase n=1 Tax=Methylopila jiangsuensis TaxID=586230 RepID=UPI0022F31E42|nr:Maf family nucleotide pyrophosphatase [Methylopila jiangsuensis]MDR6285719.1 septum formation protein [Methylopila jiangsuensis]
MTEPLKLVLASASPRRLALLEQIGVTPDALLPASVDETPERNERPRTLALRLAEAKTRAGARLAAQDPALANALVLGADTVVAVGRRILPKPENLEEAADCLRLLSGRAHRVQTAICVTTRKGALRSRLVETRVRFRRLSESEIAAYLESGEWRGKAGGYAIQGLAGAFVAKLSGSYGAVVGLPLCETANLLTGEGYPLHRGWTATA